MSDIPFATNLLPQYQSPQAMLQSGAQLNQTNAQTGQIQANTGLLGAQTQGADIANQGANLKLGLLQNYYAQNQPGANPQAPAGQAPSGETVGGTNFSPDQVSSGIIAKYAPIPTAPPPSAVAQDAYAKSIGAPELAVASYKAQVDNVNQQKQLGANGVYQMAETVASAPAGAAFDTFNRINPQAAAALKAAHPSDDPDQLDADARLLAQHTGIAVHQYTGRDTDFQNGVLVDKKDGKPVLGSEQVLTGLEGGAKAQAFKDANELVTVHNSNGTDTQVPRFQTATDPSTGKPFASAEGYYIAADKAARSVSANVSSGPPTPGNTSATAPPPKPVTAQSPAKPASVTTDPVLKDALSDPDYKLKTPPVVAGRTQSPAELDQAKTTVAARTELLSNAQDATNTGGQALQYMQAARAIMDSKGAPVTGPLGGLVAKLTSPFGSVDATNYQEVAKYLGNSAIQAGKGNFGKGMTQQDVSLQKDELSPSVHMTDDALKNLLDSGIRNTQYGMDSAKRVRAYLATGGDPQSFAEWNDKHFSRSAAVNAPAASSGPIKVTSPDQARALKPGTTFITPDGRQMVR